MDIGFVWDEEKLEIVRRKHGVRFYEVVSAFDDEALVIAEDPAGDPERFVVVGRAATHRLLTIVVSHEDLPLYRIITAFDAPKDWTDEYHRT